MDGLLVGVGTYKVRAFLTLTLNIQCFVYVLEHSSHEAVLCWTCVSDTSVSEFLEFSVC